MLLIEGLSNAQGGLLLNDANGTVSARENSYIKDVEQVLNTSVLGSEGNLAQYKVPIDKKKGESVQQIGTVNMENY